MSVSFTRCADYVLFVRMATDRINTLHTFREKKRNIKDDSDFDDADDLLSLSLIPINDGDEYNNEFLRLTAMVRTVYLSHLRQCLVNNYLTCYKSKDDSILINNQVNKYADQMELNAIRLAVQSNLYRQNMLKMIAEVKSYTIQKKPYEKLMEFLKKQDNKKCDAAVQTDDLCNANSIENTCVKSNCEKLSQITSTRFNDFYENEEIATEIVDETDTQLLETILHQESHDVDQENIDSQIINDDVVKNLDDDSRDSLLRHMENMFCESDDSNDLMQLIEKHSNVTKASIDKEINEICLETADVNITTNYSSLLQNNNATKSVSRISTPGKLTFSRYKEMRNKMATETMKEFNENETLEDKRKRRINAVWFVERVHQVSKLRAKMTELSLTNYRKHGRLKEKFRYLFGDSEEEEMMPDSPICIEEHLPACKERIAPWIVQYLMPFYQKRKIKDRQLFKVVAKYIADMLIMQNTFPEQECVSEYIERYFKNKKFIKTKQDVYL